MSLTTHSRKAASLFGCSLLVTLLSAGDASAEIEVGQKNGWTAYLEGRFNAFASYSTGDGYPADPADNSHTIGSGGGLGRQEAGPDGDNQLQSFRVRSGFLGSILAFGVRKNINENTTLKGYMAIWTTIETPRVRFQTISPDIRESYLRIEGPWGSVLAGRTLGLFSRGAVEINFLYGHNYGLGFPCNTDKTGPTCGHIGFGALYPFHAAGLVYTTPKLAGVSATAGIYDPNALAGTWQRTPLPRFEGEVAYDQGFGDVGRLHLFGTAMWQRVGRTQTNETTDAWGAGGGMRLELGPVRLGVAGHYGPGLDFYYALQGSQASIDREFKLRTFDGYYAQLMFVAGPVDLATGYGVSRLHQSLADRTPDPADPGAPPYSAPRQQRGISAGVFAHATEDLVIGVDYFRADFSWYQVGTSPVASQGVNFFNAGATMTF